VVLSHAGLTTTWHSPLCVTQRNKQAHSSPWPAYKM
jgi:hypothetical protein